MGKGQRAFEHQLENPPSSPYVRHRLRAKPGPLWVMSTEPREESREGMCPVVSVPVKPACMDLHFGWEIIGPGQFGAPLPPGWSEHKPYKEAACCTPATSQPPSLPAVSSDLRREHGESISRVQVFFWCFQLLSLPKDGRFGMSEIVIVGLMLLIGWDLRIGVPWYTVFTCF